MQPCTHLRRSVSPLEGAFGMLSGTRLARSVSPLEGAFNMLPGTHLERSVSPLEGAFNMMPRTRLGGESLFARASFASTRLNYLVFRLFFRFV